MKKKKERDPKRHHLNEIVFEWFLSARDRNIPISGPTLQEKAKEIANLLNIENFSASNGWLQRFIKRRNIKINTTCPEVNDVDKNIVDNWNDKLKDLMQKYDLKNIGTADETILFYSALPNHNSQLKSNTYTEVKHTKERLTLFLTAFANGKLEKPLVIGKYQNPKCFKYLNINKLPIIYKSDKNTCMSNIIFEEYLNYLNHKMKQENRNILLFLNRTPTQTKIQLSNIKVIYFPSHTLVLQPLTNGIIQNIKMLYRKLMLKQLLTNMDNFNTSTNSNYKLNILDAINILNYSIQCADKKTIQMCFKNCGFNSNIYKEYKTLQSEEEYKEIQELIESFYKIEKRNYNVEHFLNIDDNVGEYENGGDEFNEEDQEESDNEQDKKIPTYAEAFENIKLLQHFAKRNGEDELFHKVVELGFYFQNMKKVK